ncbi:MAG: hypothetical protein NC200_02615 [Candidatus Gastranaerophilales bacterium]|nr:hypothetical protein [Candidatus Gastranaerophilales bacterium]
MLDKVVNMFVSNEPKGSTLSRQAKRAQNKALELKATGLFSLATGAVSGVYGDFIAAPATLLGGALLYNSGKYSNQYKNIISSDAYKEVVKRAKSIKSHTKSLKV